MNVGKKMDENEGGILVCIFFGVMNFIFSWLMIKMQYFVIWCIDKINKIYDFVVVLEGEGIYIVGDYEFILFEGEGMIILVNVCFVGLNQGVVLFLGLVQYFELKVFGDYDLISLINLWFKVCLCLWEMICFLVWYYCKILFLGLVIML